MGSNKPFPRFSEESQHRFGPVMYARDKEIYAKKYDCQILPKLSSYFPSLFQGFDLLAVISLGTIASRDILKNGHIWVLRVCMLKKCERLLCIIYKEGSLFYCILLYQTEMYFLLIQCIANARKENNIWSWYFRSQINERVSIFLFNWLCGLGIKKQ